MACLTHLDVSSCPDITDDGIAVIANGRAPLRELVMRNLASVTGTKLAQLPKLRSLRCVILEISCLIPLDNAEWHPPGSSSRRLDLSGTQLLEAGLRAVMRINSLEVLSLSRCPLTNEILVGWAAEYPPKLNTLDIAECPLLTDAAMEHMAKVSQTGDNCGLEACPVCRKRHSSFTLQPCA